MQAACERIQGGWKVTSGRIQVVSPHFGKGPLGRGGRDGCGSRQEVGRGDLCPGSDSRQVWGWKIRGRALPPQTSRTSPMGT